MVFHTRNAFFLTGFGIVYLSASVQEHALD